MDIFLEEGTEQEDSQNGKYLIFSVSKENYGIEIKNISEIIGIQPITFVPKAPSYAKGIINVRGKIVPVIDVRLKFEKEPVEYDDKTSIIIVNMNDMLVGLIVDDVVEMLTIPDECIIPPPDFKTGFQNRFISGIGMVNNQVKLLLDCDKIVKSDEMEQISKMK